MIVGNHFKTNWIPAFAGMTECKCDFLVPLRRKSVLCTRRNKGRVAQIVFCHSLCSLETR